MKTILITGASSGIGLACAKGLYMEHDLILCSRNMSALSELKTDLKSPNKVSVFELDVTKLRSVQDLFAKLKAGQISVDVLINSAGLALGFEKLEQGREIDWDQMIDTNIKGLLNVTKHSLEIMKGKNRGHIINIGSIAGISSYSRGVVYAATKAAVRSISDGLRKEVVDLDIKITNVQPGLVETNFSIVRFGGDKERAKNVYEGIKPLSGGDIASLIKYIIDMPQHVQINEVTVTPLHQATVEIVHKSK